MTSSSTSRVFRRIVSKARGQYQLPPIDWDLITLPAVDDEHAMNNRLNAEQIAMVLPIVVDQYPFYAPMIFALYTLGLRYGHVAAMRSSKLGADGVIAIEESYDVSANVFSPVDQRKKAPPMIALEPRTLDLVRRHRRYLTQRSHPGLKTGLLFPSEAGTRPVGNDQLNDVWREVQVMAGIDRPVTVHGIRHTFHDLARQQGVPDAVVKAMAGRAGTDVAARGQDKHLHYSRGVTVEEMRQASMALMELIPTEPMEVQKGRDLGRDGRGRDRNSDEERLAAAATWPPSGVTCPGSGRYPDARPRSGQIPDRRPRVECAMSAASKRDARSRVDCLHDELRRRERRRRQRDGVRPRDGTQLAGRRGP